MSEQYVVTGEQTAVETSPGETILTLFASGTTRRGWMHYFTASAGGTMADQVQRVQLQRITALGTEGAGVTPALKDLGGTAAVLDGGEDHSVEPTYTAATELWDQDVHIRATPQIQLQPDSHIVLPATANAGLGMRSFSANYTGIAHAGFEYSE